MHDDFDFDLSFITNFSEDRRPFYELAIRLYGDRRLSIKDTAHAGNGSVLKGYNALFFTGEGDLTGFWTIYDALRACEGGMNGLISLQTLLNFPRYRGRGARLTPIEKTV